MTNLISKYLSFDMHINKTMVIFIVIILLICVLYVLKSKNTTIAHKIRENFELEPNNEIELKIYYTQWCGWSKRILATIESNEFKTKFKEVEGRAKIILIDCENSGKDECDKNQIKGYPTIQLFKNGKGTIYVGERTPEGIINFIKDNLN